MATPRRRLTSRAHSHPAAKQGRSPRGRVTCSETSVLDIPKLEAAKAAKKKAAAELLEHQKAKKIAAADAALAKGHKRGHHDK